MHTHKEEPQVVRCQGLSQILEMKAELLRTRHKFTKGLLYSIRSNNSLVQRKATAQMSISTVWKSALSRLQILSPNSINSQPSATTSLTNKGDRTPLRKSFNGSWGRLLAPMAMSSSRTYQRTTSFTLFKRSSAGNRLNRQGLMMRTKHSFKHLCLPHPIGNLHQIMGALLIQEAVTEASNNSSKILLRWQQISPFKRKPIPMEELRLLRKLTLTSVAWNLTTVKREQDHPKCQPSNPFPSHQAPKVMQLWQ